MGGIEIPWRFDDIVQALGDASAEAFLRREGGLTFSTTARDAWITRVEDAVRHMDQDQRTTGTDVAIAETAAQRLLSFAADRAREDARDEITESDIAAAILAIRIWPFT
jgi:hypothetical protein